MPDVVSDLLVAVAAGGPVLTDGGIETRIMFETDLPMDPHVQVAGLLGDAAGEQALGAVYRGYLAAGGSAGLPVVIGTPTFRASARYTERAGLGGAAAVTRLNHAAVDFHRSLRRAAAGPPVWIAGVLGPAGDAYLLDAAPGADEAADYHRTQADALAEAGADFLYAATFPAVGEAIGAARAMAATGLPFVVSFVVDEAGTVLDGTPLAAAIRAVDADTAPAFFSLSCVHPTVAARALAAEGTGRVKEVKANGSALSPADLVALDHPEADPPEVFARLMADVRERYAVPVVGGCCGTTDAHLRALAGLLVSR